MSKILAVASGKGGVGKTSFVLNLATALTQLGKNILVFDGDFGLANIDVQLGLSPEQDLSHVLAGQAKLVDVVLTAPQGFSVVPGRSGSSTLPFMTGLEQQDILGQLRMLAADYDLCLLDVPAGLDNTVLTLCKVADETIIVATPDPSAITDAYALMKLLLHKQGMRNIQLVVNQGGNASESKLTAGKIVTAAEKFLGLKVPVLGHVLYERTYAEAVKTQHLAVERHPNSKAAATFEQLARDVLTL